MFFLKCQSRESVEVSTSFSSSETLQYFFILVFFLFIILIALLVFNNIYNILFALWVLLFAEIYFCFYWVQSQVNITEIQKHLIKEELKTIIYIKRNLDNIIYSSKAINNSEISLQFNLLAKCNEKFTQKNQIYGLTKQISKICQQVQKISLKNKKDHDYRNILTNSLMSLQNLLLKNTLIDSEIKNRIILHSKKNDTFLNYYYNLSEIFYFFQKYNEITLFSDFSKSNLKSFKKEKLGVYSLEESMEEDLICKTINYKNNTVKIYMQKEEIINIQIFEETNLVENINFLENSPIFNINNKIYLITKEGSIELIKKNNKYSGKSILLSSKIAYNNIYKNNEYISDLVKISFNNRTISIKNQHLIDI